MRSSDWSSDVCSSDLDDRQIFCALAAQSLDQMLGVSRQTKTARHDRHAVEQDAVERRIGIRKYLAPGHKSSYVYDYRTHLLIIVLLIKVNARERRHANCRSQLYAVACPRP